MFDKCKIESCHEKSFEIEEYTIHCILAFRQVKTCCVVVSRKKNMDPSSKPMKYLAILQIKPAKFFSLHEAGKYNMVRIFSCTYVVVHCNDFSKYVCVFGKLLRNFYCLEIIDI